MTLSRKSRRYSRVVAYCLILASILALFNTALQTVSSQTFDTSTTTENSADTAQPNTTTNTNATELASTSTETAKTTTTATTTSTSTATQFTVAYATSTLHVTVYNVQYTTNDNVFTIVKVYFTTITTSLTQVELIQPIGAPSLPIHSSTSSGAPSIAADALLGHRDAGLTLQSIAASVVLIILLASIPLIRRKRK